MDGRKSVAIVGGGIAGLYTAYRLAKDRKDEFDVTVFEASPTWGGRIETVDMRGFKAEYGPMRFEPQIQTLLAELVEKKLGLKFVDFPPMSSDMAGARTAAERYDLRYDELRHTADDGVLRYTGEADEDEEGKDKGLQPPQPLALLRLGVVRMFRDDLRAYLGDKAPESLDLNADTAAELPKGFWKPGRYEAGERQWTPKNDWKVDDKYKRIRMQVQEWLDHFNDPLCPSPPSDGDTYARLRETATQLDRPLWNEAFWNAMSAELGAPAIRYIRDEGTFYHLFPDNPNAVEWGIFWLRLFRTVAQELKGIEGGSSQITVRLIKEIEKHPRVRLRPAQEVISVKPAENAGISLRIRDHTNGQEYDAEADHCVLALPLTPLVTLATHFPEEIRSAIKYGYGFPLLKCFLEVRDPWWSLKTPAQAGSFAVPTRELRYQWRADAGKEGPRGLVMLYTDHPAANFWKEYVPLPVHDRAYVSSSGQDALKPALIYHLLIHARRHAHMQVDQLLYDHYANITRDGVVGDRRRKSIKAYVEMLQKQLDRALVRDWHTRLIYSLKRDPELRDLECVLDALRNPNIFRARAEGEEKVYDKVRDEVVGWLKSLQRRPSGADDFDSLVAKALFTEGVPKRIEALDDKVEMWGIRDWARWPVGAACHAWTKGAHSWEIIDKLQAFGLIPRCGAGDLRNVHICGEALSDYQGFIEGALRTAERVIACI